MENEYQRLISTPVFPGVPRPGQLPPGMTAEQYQAFYDQAIEDMKQFIIKQKKMKGFTITVDTGASQSPIKISGEARFLLGYAFVNNPTVTSVGIELNNEIIIRDSPINFLTDAYTDDEYYFFPRPLSGQDDFVLKHNATGTTNIQFAIYYL